MPLIMSTLLDKKVRYKLLGTNIILDQMNNK